MRPRIFPDMFCPRFFLLKEYSLGDAVEEAVMLDDDTGSTVEIGPGDTSLVSIRPSALFQLLPLLSRSV